MAHPVVECWNKNLNSTQGFLPQVSRVIFHNHRPIVNHFALKLLQQEERQKVNKF
jgi:hypothetical protein